MATFDRRDLKALRSPRPSLRPERRDRPDRALERLIRAEALGFGKITPTAR